MGLWPEDWRAELARAFDPAECGPTIEVVFIGPDGQPVGEELGVRQNARSRAFQKENDETKNAKLLSGSSSCREAALRDKSRDSLSRARPPGWPGKNPC